jgi:hypothetical protein
MGTGEWVDPVNVMAKSARSPFATGKVYAVRCGWDEYFLAQMAPDSSTGLSERTISGEQLQAWLKKKPANIDLEPFRLRLQVMNNTFKDGGWIFIGRYPPSPTLRQNQKRGWVCQVSDPPIFAHLTDDGHSKYPVSEEEYGDREHMFFTNESVLWRWLTREPVMKTYREMHTWEATKLKEIAQDPEKLKLYQFLLPHMMSNVHLE